MTSSKSLLKYRHIGSGLVSRCFSITLSSRAEQKFKLVVVGGGAAGCAVSAKFAKKFGKGAVAVIEPSDKHYYQPLWTLVGGGIKTFNESHRPMGEVLPKNCSWIKEKAVEFRPNNNVIILSNGDRVIYSCLVVAMGLQLNYDWIKGLPEAFEKDSMLVSNYSAQYVTRTRPALDHFKGGNAIFTVPNTPIKCAGAPQKIMYLAEELLTKKGIRDQTDIYYTTALATMISAPKYAPLLQILAEKKGCKLKFCTSLIEVRPDTKEAVFEKIGTEPLETETIKYDFMHITPPMSTPNELKSSTLVDAAGFVTVNKHTMQHTKHKNIFAIGDCTDVPTSKTAAAAASQLGALRQNVTNFFDGKKCKPLYYGYTSCPVVTSSRSCMMAEFGYDGVTLETFPIDQGKERWSMYLIKRYALPWMYWNLHVKGKWEGPAFFRKLWKWF